MCVLLSVPYAFISIKTRWHKCQASRNFGALNYPWPYHVSIQTLMSQNPTPNRVEVWYKFASFNDSRSNTLKTFLTNASALGRPTWVYEFQLSPCSTYAPECLKMSTTPYESFFTSCTMPLTEGFDSSRQWQLHHSYDFQDRDQIRRSSPDYSFTQGNRYRESQDCFSSYPGRTCLFCR